MFDIGASGIPTSERGHGPSATNATLSAKVSRPKRSACAGGGRCFENTSRPVCPASAHTTTKLSSRTQSGPT